MLTHPAPGRLEPSIASLQAELEDARDEAELNLLQLQQVQEELEHYFLRCQQLELSAPTHEEPSPLAAPIVNVLGALDVLGPAPHLQAIRLRLQLGDWLKALAALEALIAAPDLPLPLQQQARLLLSDVRLRQGDLGAAEAQLATVRDQPREPAEDAELNRQLRIATTLRWLEQHGSSSLPKGRVMHDGLAAALDVAEVSPCGTWFCLKGWLIDNASALQGLVLVHDGQAVPLPLAAAVPRPRPDLVDLLSAAGLPPEAPIGFTHSLLLPPEQRRPRPDPTSPVVLLLLLPDGEQVCLACPATPIPFDADLARSLLPQDGFHADQTTLWSLPPWS